MRILVGTDDGIDAVGIAVLADAARRLSDDVWVVAPDGNRSAAGHGISLRRPVTLAR
ncbi:MAG: 5'/3'-nucleotidase SurE, partial [Alphaproteobacteria bacterium]